MRAALREPGQKGVPPVLAAVVCRILEGERTSLSRDLAARVGDALLCPDVAPIPIPPELRPELVSLLVDKDKVPTETQADGLLPFGIALSRIVALEEGVHSLQRCAEHLEHYADEIGGREKQRSQKQLGEFLARANDLLKSIGQRVEAPYTKTPWGLPAGSALREAYDDVTQLVLRPLQEERDNLAKDRAAVKAGSEKRQVLADQASRMDRAFKSSAEAARQVSGKLKIRHEAMKTKLLLARNRAHECLQGSSVQLEPAPGTLD